MYLFLTVLFFALSSCSKLIDDAYPTNSNIPDFPQEDWIKVENPESVGWSSSKLEEARRLAEMRRSEALMVIDNGKLIAAWGETRRKFYVASIRKSYLSTIFGYYVDGKTISLNATLNDYGIDDKVNPLTSEEKKATIRQLLTSSSGIYLPSAASDSELPPRGSTKIGEKFVYNNWDFNALGTVFEKRTGRKIYEVFDEKIAKPIGMQDFFWQTDGRYDFSSVSEHPAYHCDMTARDMARFGLLVLKKGQWNGKQIIPNEWLSEITKSQIVVPDSYGGGSYGYMWWVNDGGAFASGGIPTDGFSAQGNWSQIILVIPSKNLVIVHRAYNRKINGNNLLEIFKLILDAKK